MPPPTRSQSAPTAIRARRAETLNIPAQVRSGDLWQLGTHRLLCGDCTRSEDVAHVMGCTEGAAGGEAADMLFLDPPYGVQYGTSRGCRQPRRGLAGDDLGDHGTYDLLKRALLAAPLKPGGAFYVCSAGGSNETLFRLAVRDAGLPLKQSLVWVKHHFVVGRQDYQWKHEGLLYGWKPGAAHYYAGGRAQTTVWEIPRPLKSALHPTMKPLELVERALRNSSKEGESVFDGFGGSGTTLVACEQTGRRCRLLEIEPFYCDVIVARWERLTGGTAVRLETRGP